ncbi:autoimmune regulator-like isoform X1 [Hemibagrus wyckioides]|uniref:autoimmune regulator-like isoform X1 n=1 Tax=Hemibagrus wyckioides TaxID=337641 RepID=UPI00266CEFBB|nr:autoimmune regulator-like isoform X1 [Hemibagrus wyckioides]XP_058260974.1 autoimmune regulator-like isoform X1 [Hemibagrus wyckioides]XP_058260975.1 autoimmune regulator-like isoform X1 [Hemibagrus wyckioides]
MDQLDFITHEELVVFFRRKKTEISCMEEPHIFLMQLRDHDLVPEDLYKEVIKRKSKKTIQDGVYKILDWVEKKGGDHVKEFWKCVFQHHIQQEYPVFRTLLRNLQDGSFKKCVKLSDTEKPRKRKGYDEEIKEEEPGPSSGSSQKKAAKEPTFSSLHRRQKIPVTCGEKKGLPEQDHDNDDVCYICNTWGNLVCCDGCPRAFHRDCHLPTLQEDETEGTWKCSFCVLKTNQGLRIPPNHSEALRKPWLSS